VSSDSDRLIVGGAVLRTGLGALLRLVAEVLETASYPTREVAGERSRLAERLAILRSQPSVLVGEALNSRLYGSHPYARELATPEAVQAVTAAQLRKLHSDRVRPEGSALVLVGDLSPARALDTVESALGGWTGESTARPLPPLPPVRPQPLLLVDRPGSVQASIRLGGPAVRRRRRTTRRCSWRTWPSAATSPPGWWRTSARTRATRTVRTAGSATAWPVPGWSSTRTWRPR
jgi:predicted Zn-dependent peptidase